MPTFWERCIGVYPEPLTNEQQRDLRAYYSRFHFKMPPYDTAEDNDLCDRADKVLED